MAKEKSEEPEINPHLELSDEEYFIQYKTPDEIEQQIITEEEHGK